MLALLFLQQQIPVASWIGMLWPPAEDGFGSPS
jgi:hypothetical protein